LALRWKFFAEARRGTISAVAFSILKIPALVLAQISDAVVAAVEPLPTLQDLALSAPNPTSLDDLAPAVGVRPELLHRVSRGRQPLPAQLVDPIAAVLGVQRGEVIGAAGAILDTGGSIAEGISYGASALIPLPPDRLLGDPIYFRPTATTAPVIFGS